jgi:hypothetical protein
MPTPEDIAHEETRAVLDALHQALGMPPIPAPMRQAVEQLLDLLGEGDTDKRWAARERVAELLAEQNGGASGAWRVATQTATGSGSNAWRLGAGWL